MLRSLWANRPGSGGGSASDLPDRKYSGSVCAGEIHIVPLSARYCNDQSRAWYIRYKGNHKNMGIALCLRFPDRRGVPVLGAVCTDRKSFSGAGGRKLLHGIGNLEHAYLSGETEPVQMPGNSSAGSKKPESTGVDRYGKLPEG